MEQDLGMIDTNKLDGNGSKGNSFGGNECDVTVKRRVYNKPQEEAKISELSNKNFAVESKKKIRWAVNMFEQWHLERLKNVLVASEIRNCDLSFVKYFSKSDLCYCLERFITEVKKLDNTDFPGKTLREIVIMIQMHLHESGVYWKLLDDSEFKSLRNILDNTMKDRHARGLGVRQSCDIISLSHENLMFERNALGEEHPEQLLRTVIYMLGLHLALHGDVEHLRLRRPGFDPQITTELDNASGQEILIYREDPLQKTNQGGLDSKPHNKIVKVYPSENFHHCPVRLYGKYIGLLPSGKSCGKLYLRPKVRNMPSVWYNDQPYGKNKITTAVKTLCKIANLEGRFTNHSLRATAASRMFEKSIPEQVIKEITGHRSECVRVYKRTSNGMLKYASDSINGVTSGDKNVELKQDDVVCDDAKESSVSKLLSPGDSKRLKETLSNCQMIKNVVKTRMEMRQSRIRSVVSKMAKKILKSKKEKVAKKQVKCNKVAKECNNIVINLNVNLKCLK